MTPPTHPGGPGGQQDQGFINNPYFLWVEVLSMSVKEVSLYFLGGVQIQYFWLTLSTPGLLFSVHYL